MSVMNIKRGTQAWGKGESDASMRSGAQGDEPQNLSAGAADLKKAFGEQPVGDVLNKIADPNWVDPTRKVRTTGNKDLDKDAFFKLMLAQMKNQDPTNPMQPHEMSAQLAQFSSLEQLHNINASMENLSKSQANSGQFAALQFIGKKVSGDASKISRAAGDTEHAFNFDLAQESQKTKVTVKDETGKAVRVLELGAMKKGGNKISWNGLMDDGLPARPGEYHFTVEANASNGAKVYARSAFEGRITGVDFTPSGTNVIVNGQSVRLSDIKKIEEALPEAVPTAMQMMKPATGLEQVGASKNRTQNLNAKNVDSFIPPAPEVDQPGNIADVPMAGNLLAQVNGASQGKVK